jgi:hypothetical protein
MPPPKRDMSLSDWALEFLLDREIAQLSRAVSKVLENEDDGLCAICHQPESKHALVGSWCKSENEDGV